MTDTHQLGDNTLQGWGKVLQEAAYVLNQVSNIWHCFSHNQDSQVQESRGRNGSGTIYYYL